MASTFPYSRFDRGPLYSRFDGVPLLSALGVPSFEFAVLRLFLRVCLRIDADVHDGGLAAGEGSLDGRADLVFLLDILAMAAETLGDLVETHVLAPVHTRLRGRLLEGALVHADLETPLMVDPYDAHQRNALPRRSFEFGDVEQEGRVAGEQHDGTLASLGDGGADRIRQPGAEVTEILVPDHVARLGLRVGPLEDDGGAAV